MSWEKAVTVLAGLAIGVSLSGVVMAAPASEGIITAQAADAGQAYHGTLGTNCTWDLSADGKTLTIAGGEGGGTLPEGDQATGGVIGQKVTQAIQAEDPSNKNPLYNLEEINLVGDLKTGSSAEALFEGFNNHQIDLKGLENLNTQAADNMDYMFSNSDFKSLNLTKFDTKNVEDMTGMFLGTTIPALNLSGFDTSNVTSMADMFSWTSGLKSLDVSGLNTLKVSTMLNMFYQSSDLESIKLGGKFDTRNVQVMAGMFSFTPKLTSLDLSQFNTENASGMNRMFEGSGAVTLDLSSFDTKNVTNFSAMFRAAENLEQVNLSSFRTPNAHDFDSMFLACTNLKQLDLSKFDTQNVVSKYKGDSGGVHGMFAYDPNLTSLDISSFKMTYDKTNNWYTYTDEMFSEDDKLSRLVLGPNVRFLSVPDEFANTLGTGLSNLVADKTYTGKWQAVGAGTEANPQGTVYATSDDLVNAYMDDTRPAGVQTYVWQPVNRPVTPPVTPTVPPKPTPVPDEPDEVFTGSSLNAIKKIGFYRRPTFTDKNRITWFAKAPRTRQPQFVVIGKATSKHGVVRYRVRDVNRHSKTYRLTGYVTTRAAYVEPTYVPKDTKAKRITVINPRGINGYDRVNLTQKRKHYRQGQQLQVKRIVTHNLTTRFQLPNGQYVTANRQWIQTGGHTYPRKITTKHTIWRYRDVNFQQKTHHYRRHQQLRVLGWDYSDHGTLRYRVAGGYITANTCWVKVVKR